jgi:hypothetical protein
MPSLVGSVMCIRDSSWGKKWENEVLNHELMENMGK